MNKNISISKLVVYLKNIDKKTSNLIKKGLHISLLFSIIGTIFLLYYIFFTQNLIIYDIGFSILKSSIIFAVAFIICGISMDSIKKEIL